MRICDAMWWSLISLREDVALKPGRGITLSFQVLHFFQVGKSENVQFTIMVICWDVNSASVLADTKNYHLFFDTLLCDSYHPLLYAIRAPEQNSTGNKGTEKALAFTRVLNRLLKIAATLLSPYSAVFSHTDLHLTVTVIKFYY